MSIRTLAALLLSAALFTLVVHSPASAQVADQRLDALTTKMERLKSLLQKFPENQRRALSSGAQNLLTLAEHWREIKPLLRTAPPTIDTLREQFSKRSLKSTEFQIPPPFFFGPVPVSEPGFDFLFSALAGFTQSETSTAWCGNNVVVGFNDSGSVFESLFFGPGGLSFNGVGRSGNQGLSYEDLFFLNPGPDFFDFLGGDPVVACTDPGTFYYASLFDTSDMSGPLSAISVSKSIDGGLSFDNPVPAASKDALTHFLDKPWMAADPSNSNRIYVTYTDFDFSGTSPACPADFRTAIEIVHSMDGGVTWGMPLVIDEVCGDPFVQGSQVVVGPGGEVYVAWESVEADFITRDLRIRTSTDNGSSFDPAVIIDPVTCVGECFRLQGGFRSAFEFPLLAVDRSGTATHGNLYVTWHDGRNLQVPDLVSFSGFYSYADVLVSTSTDGGATWSAPVRANTNVDPVPGGNGTDQWQPGIAVDRTGRVGVCFYDRRRDPLNFFFDRFCALSTDGGATWSNSQKNFVRSQPIHATDIFINTVYMGDYDGVTTDFTSTNGGFLNAFQQINRRGNPDVKAVRFP